MSEDRVYEFDGFRVYLDERVLIGPSGVVALFPKALDVLVVLIENRGRLVTERELSSRLRIGEALRSSIAALQAALGENPAGRPYIEIERGGYRFLGDGVCRERTISLRPLVPWFVAILVVGAGAAAFVVMRPQRAEPSPLDRIAVWPFANSTGDPDSEYLSEGITESLINRLSRNPGVRVTARTTVFTLKRRGRDAHQAGRELEVGTVLTGTVGHRDGTVYIDAELVRVSDGSALWSHRYQQPFGNILAIQDDIAAEISRRLQTRFTGASGKQLSASQTSDPEAYRLYLQGRHFWNRRSDDAFKEAVSYFERAIQRDPKYALAYVGLADCYALMAPGTAFRPKAREAIVTALRIDPSNADAHASLAGALQREQQWTAAEQEYKEAIGLNPNYATARQWYALYLAARGRHREASSQIEKAEELDPLSVIINTHKGFILYLDREYQRAIGQFQRILELEPEFEEAQYELAVTLLATGGYGKASDLLSRLAAKYEGDTEFGAALGFAYARGGRRDDALRILARYEQMRSKGSVPAIYFTFIHMGLGDNAKALDWLDKAIREQSHLVLYLRVSPMFDTLRMDSRFAELVRRAGL